MIGIIKVTRQKPMEEGVTTDHTWPSPVYYNILLRYYTFILGTTVILCVFVLHTSMYMNPVALAS